MPLLAAVCLPVSPALAGGFASWASEHGIPAEEAGDSDHDGIPALVEYALGLDPNGPDASPAVLEVGRLSFAKNPEAVAAGDVSYAIETSRSCEPGSWSLVVPDIDDATAISWILPTGREKIFARLAVTLADADPAPEGFASIAGGTFRMGDSFGEGDSDELPVHEVHVSGFHMGKYEVTKALWDEVRAWGANHGYTDLLAGEGKAVDHPVQSINWYAVVKWCNARSEKENLTPCYTVGGSVYRTGNSDAVTCDWNADGYRLPTEAEWEKAARGGLEGRRFPWGDTIMHSQANYVSSSSYAYDISPTRGYHPAYNDGTWPFTSPVGSFAPNGYGLYDMSGNVWEWCWDLWDRDYYLISPPSDPRGGSSGSRRILRGGCWNNYPKFLRCASRSMYGPGNSNSIMGFRLARGQP